LIWQTRTGIERVMPPAFATGALAYPCTGKVHIGRKAHPKARLKSPLGPI
jgi:hypothetical protein